MRNPVPAFYLLMGTGMGLTFAIVPVAAWTLLDIEFPVVVALGLMGGAFTLAASILRRRFQSRLLHKPTEAI